MPLGTITESRLRNGPRTSSFIECHATGLRETSSAIFRKITVWKTQKISPKEYHAKGNAVLTKITVWKRKKYRPEYSECTEKTFCTKKSSTEFTLFTRKHERNQAASLKNNQNHPRQPHEKQLLTRSPAWLLRRLF